MKAILRVYFVPASPMPKAASQMSLSLDARYTQGIANHLVLLEAEVSRASRDETDPPRQVPVHQGPVISVEFLIILRTSGLDLYVH